MVCAADVAEVDCGLDNRHLNDDGTSQKLSREEIFALKASGASEKEVSHSCNNINGMFG